MGALAQKATPAPVVIAISATPKVWANSVSFLLHILIYLLPRLKIIFWAVPILGRCFWAHKICPIYEVGPDIYDCFCEEKGDLTLNCGTSISQNAFFTRFKTSVSAI